MCRVAVAVDVVVALQRYTGTRLPGYQQEEKAEFVMERVKE